MPADKATIFASTAILLLVAIPVFGVQMKGAEQLVISGGGRGDISFPHRTHQQAVENCGICHTLFPQTAGSIERLKSQGELQRMQVMNKLCLKCHREKRRKKVASGPISCSECHRR